MRINRTFACIIALHAMTMAILALNPTCAVRILDLILLILFNGKCNKRYAVCYVYTYITEHIRVQHYVQHTCM